MIAPIVVVAFNRPDHLQRTLSALTVSDLAAKSDICIYCDGPRNDDDIEGVAATRRVAASVSGFKSVHVVERPVNLGLSANTTSAISDVIGKYGKAVILDDDIYTAPYFLQFMNDALNLYQDDERVAQISGFTPLETDEGIPATFFLRGGDCWGWATWKRAWDCFDANAGKHLIDIYRQGLEYEFDQHDSYAFTKTLHLHNIGAVSSWDTCWHASMFLRNMYTLYPGKSLVRNIGNDGTGAHCVASTLFDGVPFDRNPVAVTRQPVTECEAARKQVEQFYRSLKKATRKMKARQRGLLSRLSPSWWAKRKERKQRRRARQGFFDPAIPSFPDWASACAAAEGYDAESITTKVVAAARMVRDGRALWERDSVLFYREEYTIPLVAALMTIAARNRGRLSVLDFGGALGSTYMQHRSLFSGLESIAWHVVEQPHFVAIGTQEFSSDVLRFWPTMDACAEQENIDVILFSGVLQYMEDPYALVGEACALDPKAILIDRTPFAQNGEKIIVQHVPEAIYKASYACRLLDREKLKAAFPPAYHCLPEFPSQVDPQGFCGFMAVRKDRE
ncbi:methyltransferase, TIGR04325 family [Desulfovibrio sp. OttesenSCG-928-I05]|nr:methyltransferase, TIGR04325 family [Desulfovibrio sp. OttesenSCG-928-I05]